MKLFPCLVLSFAFSPLVSAAPKEAPPSFELIRLDRKGNLRDADRLKDLAKRFAKEQPTHLFVMAHGWNNGEDESRRSYQRMTELLQSQANDFNLRKAGIRPAFVGLHWPSLAFDGDEEVSRLLLNLLPAAAKKQIKPILQLGTLRKKTL